MKWFVMVSLLVSTCVGAESIKIPVDVYAPDQPYHGMQGTLELQLPQGWSHSAHNGIQYLYGGRDVYGSITLGYHALSVFNLSSQFGTPEPPVTAVGEVKVMHKKVGNGASFAVKLKEPGWILRASLSKYPDFSEADIADYQQQFVEIMGTAKVVLPTTK